MMSVADLITIRMDSLSFLSQNIEANETIVVEKDSHSLDWDRLRDANDNYEQFCSTWNERSYSNRASMCLECHHQKYGLRRD